MVRPAGRAETRFSHSGNLVPLSATKAGDGACFFTRHELSKFIEERRRFETCHLFGEELLDRIVLSALPTKSTPRRDWFELTVSAMGTVCADFVGRLLASIGHRGLEGLARAAEAGRWTVFWGANNLRRLHRNAVGCHF